MLTSCVSRLTALYTVLNTAGHGPSREPGPEKKEGRRSGTAVGPAARWAQQLAAEAQAGSGRRLGAPIGALSDHAVLLVVGECLRTRHGSAGLVAAGCGTGAAAAAAAAGAARPRGSGGGRTERCVHTPRCPTGSPSSQPVAWQTSQAVSAGAAARDTAAPQQSISLHSDRIISSCPRP